MEILSYRWEEGGKVKEETLKKHIEHALELVRDVEKSRIGRYARKLGFSDFSRAIRLSVIFHDSGKIFYQRPWDRLSFRGHEYLSTFIADYFFRELVKFELKKIENLDIMRNICIFAIFFHHHAMNVRLRAPKVDERDVENGIKMFGRFHDDVESMLNGSEIEALDRALRLVAERRGAIANSTKKYVEGVVREVWFSLNRDAKLKKLAYLNLDALIVSDNISAHENRGGGKRRFLKVMEEFRELYLKPL